MELLEITNELERAQQMLNDYISKDGSVSGLLNKVYPWCDGKADKFTAADMMLLRMVANAMATASQMLFDNITEVLGSVIPNE